VQSDLKRKLTGPSGGGDMRVTREPRHFATHRKKFKVEFSRKALTKDGERLSERVKKDFTKGFQHAFIKKFNG